MSIQTMTRRDFLRLTAIVGAGSVLGSFSAIAPAPAVAAPTAQTAGDTVFMNGTIHPTVAETATAIAIRGGKVVALGDQALTLANATRVDLQGAHLFPGFHDSHIHVLISNFASQGVALQGVTSMAQIKQTLKNFIARNKPANWIYGFGWDLSSETPSGLALDEVTGAIPTALYDRGGHTAMLNSAGMKRAGITEQAPNPPGGEFVRDGNGRLTGWMREAAVVPIIQTILGELTAEEITRGLPEFLHFLAQHGVTSISDNIGETGTYMPALPQAYLKLARTGKVPIRVHYLPIFYKPEDVDKVAEWIKPEHNTELVTFASGKVFVDGGFDTGGAYTSFPHKHKEVVFYTQAQLDEVVARAEKAGLPMQYHLNGDLAIEMALNALEKAAAQNGGKLKARHVPVHIGFATQTQRERIKKLGVTVAVQPVFWDPDNDAMDVNEYGDKFYEAYNNRALVQMGIPAGYGTDFAAVPIEQLPPLVGLKVVQTEKVAKGGNVRQLTAAEFIKGYTEGSALTVGRSDLGNLKAGMAADFIITDQDLLAVPMNDYPNAQDMLTTAANALPAVHILETWVAGKRVYKKE